MTTPSTRTPPNTKPKLETDKSDSWTNAEWATRIATSTIQTINENKDDSVKMWNYIST
uniref:Uncharacterized protein n=1 Tax=Moniliophthora roreri TaxID=221103 RepID=A0A0W0GFT1_MONRR